MKQIRHVSKAIAEGITKDEAETESQTAKNPYEITLDDLIAKVGQAELHTSLDGYGDDARYVAKTIREGTWLLGPYYYGFVTRMYKDIFPGLSEQRLETLASEANLKSTLTILKGHGFTRDELYMIVDVNADLFLFEPKSVPGLVLTGVLDSFQLPPGSPELRFGVERKDMVPKLQALTEEQRSVLGFWVIAVWRDPHVDGDENVEKLLQVGRR